MLGQRLLEKFNDYDLNEVESTFDNIVSLCADLDRLEGRRKFKNFEDSMSGKVRKLPTKEKLEIKRKWIELFKVAEDIDFLFIEDY